MLSYNTLRVGSRMYLTEDKGMCFAWSIYVDKDKSDKYYSEDAGVRATRLSKNKGGGAA